MPNFKTPIPWRAITLTAAALTGALTGAPVTLENETFTATVDRSGDKAVFSMTDKSSGKVVVENGVLLPLDHLAGEAVAGKISDPVFGDGRRATFTFDSGSIAVECFPKLPFLLVRTALKNSTDKDQDVERKNIADYTYAAPAAGLKTAGTAGPTEPGKNPGSYLFLACADPATRHGVVSGWITQKRGSGTVFSTVENDKVKMTGMIQHGHLILKPGQSSVLDTFAIGYFPDARVGLETFSDTVVKTHDIKLHPKTAVYCTWYAEGAGHGMAGTPESTLELAKFIKDKNLREYGLGVIQLDDFWQDGPRLQGPSSEFGEVDPKGPYKDGITPVAEKVKATGLDFGLWWLPFGRNHTEPQWKNKPDWFVKKPDGTPLRQRSFGGTCLDSTNPEVRDYLTSLAKRIKDWDVDYFKMDGLSAGAGVDHCYINDGYKEDGMGKSLPLHDPSKTHIEMMRMGLEALRKGAGPDTFFSGCCAVQNMRIYAGSIGLVDSMRVGPDFNHDGEGIRSGVLRGSWVYFLNGKVWWNDPDPTKLRDNNESSDADNSARGAVSTEQARMTSSWVALTNQFYLLSDWLPNLPEERIDIMKRTMAAHHGTTRPVDFFDNKLPNTWHVEDAASGTRRDLIGVFNFYKDPLAVKHSLGHIGLAEGRTYHAFDFWANKRVADIKGEFTGQVPPNSCVVLSLREDDGKPCVISTSRHVTQGMVDLKKEVWKEDALGGISEVIGGDPYELRIIVPEGYKPGAVKISTADVVSTAAEDGLLRVKFTPAKSGRVSWSVKFGH